MRLVVALLAVLLIAPAYGELVREDPLEAQVRELARDLRCTVCQSESVWESNSTLARQMRELIRTRLAEGESREDVLRYMQSRYGDFILMAPPKRGLNWLLWGLPFVLLVLGLTLLGRTLAAWSRAAAAGPAAAPPPMDEATRRRIEAELERLGEER
jgi:cytochrome c-type biogenesis protein CcmH